MTEPVHHVVERLVWHRLAFVAAAREQHRCRLTLAQAGEKAANQRRLAETRAAPDEHHLRASRHRGIERAIEHAQLRRAAYERRRAAARPRSRGGLHRRPPYPP